MENKITVAFPLNELAAAIIEQLKPLIDSLTQPVGNAEQERFLTRKQTAALLNISLPTLTNYTKHGKIIGYRLGARVLYTRSEITLALQKIKGGYHE